MRHAYQNEQTHMKSDLSNPEALDYIRSYTTIERDNPEFFATLKSTLDRNQKENVKPLEELTFIVNGKKVKATEFFKKMIKVTKFILEQLMEN